MATLHWELREIQRELRHEGRLNILIAMLLRANIRLRCYPSTEQLMEDTDLAKATVNAGRKWLISRRFVVLVPYKLRVDDERKLPVRQHVYQLTGVYLNNGTLRHYLYMTPEAFSELQARVKELEQFKSSAVESSIVESSLTEISIAEPKGITSIKGNSTSKGNANTEHSSSPDGDAASSQPSGTQSSSSADAYRQVFGAVVEAWGHNGARAGNIAAMICGISKVKGWKEFNFDPPGNVAGVAVFKHWYTAQNKSATFPQSPEAIQAWYYKMRHDFQKNPHKAVFAPMRAMLPATVSDEPEFTGSLTGARHE